MADHEIVTLLRTANVESLLGGHRIPWLGPDPDVSLRLVRFAILNLVALSQSSATFSSMGLFWLSTNIRADTTEYRPPRAVFMPARDASHHSTLGLSFGHVAKFQLMFFSSFRTLLSFPSSLWNACTVESKVSQVFKVAALTLQLFRKRSCRCQTVEPLSSVGAPPQQHLTNTCLETHNCGCILLRASTYHAGLAKAEVTPRIKAATIVCDSGTVLHIGKTRTPILHLLLSRTRVKRPGPHGTITGTERYCRSSASCNMLIMFFLLWFCTCIYTASFGGA